ncbi:GNAT family N-acetyltransferase [Xenorhabdus ishibashii]|uniref:GCN5 family acetyltransferase n=1 Tax=Xenorhabdus ishibashii TaxID=1034471 RepID=A0A2D0KHD0_9GAMM|nr:GNAT family N-acetyltransferase [Xenorhabdus ishibashii]PHM62841.1 GCN5 family acetyltransferase [Xenorhabdus ishibashii]
MSNSDKPFFITQLDDSISINRSEFNSESAPINRYFQKQVTQDIRRRITTCYVAIDTTTNSVGGFYTLAAGTVLLNQLPPNIAKKLPLYSMVPVVKMGRLAVDQKYTGQGLGGALLGNALLRVANELTIGSYALTVDAKDAKAAEFYTYHGFIELQNEPLMLFFPLVNVAPKST